MQRVPLPRGRQKHCFLSALLYRLTATGDHLSIHYRFCPSSQYMPVTLLHTCLGLYDFQLFVWGCKQGSATALRVDTIKAPILKRDLYICILYVFPVYVRYLQCISVGRSLEGCGMLFPQLRC